MHHPSRQDNTRRGRRPDTAKRCYPPLAALLALLAAAAPGAAVEVSGIDVPERVTVDGRTLTLNGAGLRSSFFVRVYVGALYLERAGLRSAEAVLAAPGTKRVSMHVVYDGLTRARVTGAWSDGFEANTPAGTLAGLRPRVDAFNALWPDLAPGDLVHVDFPDGDGVRVSVNGAERGSVDGGDFQQAVLRIWLGDEPADGDLKRGMLGLE